MSGPLTPSQTVGPFFGVGLPLEKGEQLAPPGSAGSMRTEGQVLDGRGEPVPDALLEIWQPGTGFGRGRTDSEGAFTFTTVKPGAVPAPDGRKQAPHFNVTVFARGLRRHLVTRMYFPDDIDANATEPVLNMVEPARRQTLIAKNCGGVPAFDARLQSARATCFFAL